MNKEKKSRKEERGKMQRRGGKSCCDVRRSDNMRLGKRGEEKGKDEAGEVGLCRDKTVRRCERRTEKRK